MALNLPLILVYLLSKGTEEYSLTCVFLPDPDGLEDASSEPT